MRQRVSLSLIAGLGMIVAVSISAAAQSAIQLNAGAGQTITFQGQGSASQDVGVTLGACNLMGDCVLAGGGTGSGDLASSGAFTIQSTANSIMVTPGANGALSASNSAPIAFTLTGTTGTQTGTLLAGSLNFLNFSSGPTSPDGMTADVLNAALHVTNGLLAQIFVDGGAALALNVEFPCNSNVTALAGTKMWLLASLSANSAGGISPAPEPSTLALVGMGLLALGVGIRRRQSRAVPLLAA